MEKDEKRLKISQLKKYLRISNETLKKFIFSVFYSYSFEDGEREQSRKHKSILQIEPFIKNNRKELDELEEIQKKTGPSLRILSLKGKG